VQAIVPGDCFAKYSQTNVQMNMNWKGRGGKLAISGLSLTSIIISKYEFIFSVPVSACSSLACCCLTILCILCCIKFD